LPYQHAAGSVTVFVRPRPSETWERQAVAEPGATQAGQEAYGLRKLTERINGNLKNHEFGVLHVPGLIKAKVVAL
jgi:hypothetical protein